MSFVSYINNNFTTYKSGNAAHIYMSYNDGKNRSVYLHVVPVVAYPTYLVESHMV